MKKIYTLFLIALFGLGQVYGATLYGKVAVGAGKGEASVQTISNYFNISVDGPNSTTTSTQAEATASTSSVSWAYCKFSATAATGYTFDGWYTNSACTEGKQTANPYSTSSSKNSDRTDEYWAKFTPNTYKVTFNPEGGSVEPKTKNVTFDATYGEGGWPTPTRTGYKFDGWYKVDGTTLVESETAVTTASNLALYAHWTPITYKVAFDGNGSTEGSMEAEEFTYDEAKNLTANAYAQKYTVQFDAKVSEVASQTSLSEFIGWAASAEGEKVYDNEQSVSNLTEEDNATIQLFALWNAGSVVLPAVEKEEYQFEGWFLNNEKIGDAGFKYVPTADATLTAHWTSFGTDEIFFCKGGSVEYNGKEYTAAAEEVVTLNEKNQYGGDSIVSLKVTVLLPSDSTEYKTIVYGAEESWNEIALNDSTVGEHIVTYVTMNAAGCDSTVTLYLTVEKQEAEIVQEELTFCAGDLIEYHGKTITETEIDTIIATGDIRDTVYIVTATKLLPTASEEYKTIMYGAEEIWNYIALNDSAVGEHIVTYVTTNAAGCDSTVTLYLTVEKLKAEEIFYPIGFCAGDSAEYRGKWYYEAGEDTILVEDAIRDTLIYVTIAILPEDLTTLDDDTLHVGDTLLIEPNVWYKGEELLTDTAIVPTEAGESDLIQTQKNEYGCDSVIVRHIIVLEKEIETPTAIERVNAAEKAVKQLRNGIIYIRRNNKEFTTDGKIVK